MRYVSCIARVVLNNKVAFVSICFYVHAKSRGQSTAYGLDTQTPETTITTTSTWSLGGEEAQLTTVSSILAPNVGLPRYVSVNRRDSGYVSLDKLAMSRLATPEEFHRSTRSQASPVSERFPGDNRIPFGSTRAPKNVIFRDVRGRE